MFLLQLSPAGIIAFAITAILAFAYHEFAHAIAADRLGDSTPREYGRISLNPIVHLNLFGIIMLFVAGFGWATTPVNPYRLKGNPRTSMAIVALAGPAANLIMAVLFALPLRFGLISYSPGSDIVSQIFATGVKINVLLLLFNLIPLPPLDGFTLLLGLLPPDLAYRLEPLRQYGSMLLIVLIFFLPIVGINILGLMISPLRSFIEQLLAGTNLYFS